VSGASGSWQKAFIVVARAVVTMVRVEAEKTLPYRTKDRLREKLDFGCCTLGKSKAAPLKGSLHGCIG
jgi:hypothetical protein